MEKEKELTVEEVFGDQDQDYKEQGLAISKSKIIGRGLILTACFLILLMAILYILSLLKEGYGSFTVRAGDIDSEDRFSLSETIGFANPTVMLSAIPVDDMDNITYEWLDVDEICSHDGSNNKDNYFAYSFYLKNVSNEEYEYNYQINILDSTKGIDEAVRILVRKNDEITIYAKARKNGESEIYPSNLENFVSERVAVAKDNNILKPSEIDRYSVIIWLEGEDPECVDQILSGVMKMEMDFNVGKFVETEYK